MTIAKTPAEIEADVLAEFATLTGKTLLAADPRRLLLQAVTAKLAHLYSLIELADQRNLPTTSDGAGADGDRLDDLGTFVGATRSAGQASVTTIRYTRTSSIVELTIPSGHRVTTPDGAFIWASTAELVLGVGTPTGDVSSRCAETGPESNDLAPGAIDTLVDPIAGVTVTNTTTTDGGSDEQTDDEFRPAVIAAPDGFTTCGPRSAYEWHAAQASPLVLDVTALGPDDDDTAAPGDGEVAIFLLIGEWNDDGELVLETDPTVIADVISLVEVALSADTVRPIGDSVTVAEAAEVSFSAQTSYWIPQSEAANVAAIQAAVEAAQDAYLDWQESENGRDIDPSELQARLYVAGARRITITDPSFQAVQRSEHAVRDSYVTAPTYMGLFS